MAPLMTQAQLLEELHYDAITGNFCWRRGTRGRKVGDVVGSHDRHGYLIISVLGRKYRAHRLAWLYVHGTFPVSPIDHIDGNRAHNAISNLRVVTQGINVQNRRNAGKSSKTGVLGAGWDSRTGSFKSRIQLDGKSIWLGRFKTALEAHQAYVSAKRCLHVGNTL